MVIVTAGFKWAPETDPATFLGIAAEHAAEGFYSDPGNGGNIGSVSWAMVGFRVTG